MPLTAVESTHADVRAGTSRDFDEQIIYTFQSSPKIHLVNLIWYFFGTLLLGAALQLTLGYFAIGWQQSFILVPVAIICLIAEALRRATRYTITNRRVIKETNVLFLHSATDYYFEDFSRIYLYSKFGFIFGYDNLHFVRTEIVENFFGHVTISGLNRQEADKIISILEETLISKK